MTDLLSNWLARGGPLAMWLTLAALLAALASLILAFLALRRRSPLLLGYAAVALIIPPTAGLTAAILTLIAGFQPAAHGGPLPAAPTLRAAIITAIALVAIGTLLSLPALLLHMITRLRLR